MRLTARSVRRTVAATAALVWGAACGATPTEPAFNLSAARARWARRAPSAYSVTIVRTCECLPPTSGPVVVTVRDGVVTARRYAGTDAAVSASYAALFPDVEGLFALVDAGIRSGTRPLDARYDASFGYPIRIVVGDPAADAPVTAVVSFRVE